MKIEICMNECLFSIYNKVDIDEKGNVVGLF